MQNIQIKQSLEPGQIVFLIVFIVVLIIGVIILVKILRKKNLI